MVATGSLATRLDNMPGTHVDVLIVGAGISGIGAAYHLQTHSPGQSYLIIEARQRVGGTWDLFRYPGIRSDSDMYTFGFKFKPWVYEKAISPGKLIRNYVHEAAVENGIDKHIEFSSRVTSANWDSSTALWLVEIDDLESGEHRSITCKFFFSCGGYYDYANGYLPEFKDRESFNGQIIHPQHWPEELDYSGKKIVIIGSGATAVTLAPTLAQTARHVTMLQRSPTYIVSRPGKDALACFLQKWLPTKLAYALVRWKNIVTGIVLFWFSKHFPETVKNIISNGAKKILGDDYDVAKHFTPTYKPWDQRICLVPDGDLFHAVKNNSVTIVTDIIDRFTPRGVLLTSGQELEADLIVTATGLKVEVFGGMQFSVDDKAVSPSETFCYKGMMLSGLPNMAFSVGYTNASWTLKSDLIGEYVSRLINYMAKHNFDYCVPQIPPEGIQATPLMDFTSGYVQRAQDQLPHQGSKKPWKLYQNYILDHLSLGRGSVTDTSIKFGRIDKASKL